MNEIQLHRIDLNLLVTFEALMEESTPAAAADRLAVTPSAVSHALGRLRTQFNDPLLVRAGGRMRPSPYALELIEEVRPVLRSLRRMLAPRDPFDPATSDRDRDRVFRIMMSSSPSLVTAVLGQGKGAGARGDARVGERQHAGLWRGRRRADGRGACGRRYPVAGAPRRAGHGEPFTWCTFARADRPASRDWGRTPGRAGRGHPRARLTGPPQDAVRQSRSRP